MSTRTDQAVLLAHALDFQPRPVFQSYMAYTPRLARMNADVLLDEHAPEWILFPVMTIDRRLPALDDAPSWPLLLTHYQLAGAPGGIPLLRRSATPLPWHFEPLRHFETETGQFVHVPSAADGLIWARIDVHETRRDALVGALLSSRRPTSASPGATAARPSIAWSRRWRATASCCRRWSRARRISSGSSPSPCAIWALRSRWPSRS